MVLDRSWRGFFRAIGDWKENPDKFLSRPRIPGNLHKDGEFVVIFTNQQCKIRDGMRVFPRRMGIKGVKVGKCIRNDILREVRLVPKGTGYWLEIVYEKEIRQATGLDERAAIA